MSKNLNREPVRINDIGKTLKFIAGTAAFLTGAFALSRLSIFTGRQFITAGLTDDQIKAMDEHNKRHSERDSVFDLGTSLLVIASRKPKDYEKLKKLVDEVEEKMKNSLNSDVKDLPGTLAHTH